MAILRDLGDLAQAAVYLGNLGLLACRQGAHDVAARLLREGLALWREQGNTWWGVCECLEGLGAVALEQGQAERGARLYGATEALFGAMAPPRPTAEQVRYENQVASLRTTLGEAAFTAAWAEGGALSVEDEVAFALGETQEG
jgi:hypothetical protein